MLAYPQRMSRAGEEINLFFDRVLTKIEKNEYSSISALSLERVKGVEPSSHPWQGCIITVIRHPQLVPRAGIEPSTLRFSVACSTTELPRRVGNAGLGPATSSM